MAGYHSALAVHLDTSYCLVVFMAGHYPDSAKLMYDAFEIFQPAISKALADAATHLYAGEWSESDDNSDRRSFARIAMERGTLYTTNYTLLGVHRVHILDTGIPGYSGQKHMGCYLYWKGQGPWGVRDNAAIR
ncbi:hypothetical protein C8Q79DRAFT_1002628 [Trametes meyenii]|nr:hypothetical protein C8Q79DRAFT_1002628 [Trametes meyenii]